MQLGRAFVVVVVLGAWCGVATPVATGATPTLTASATSSATSCVASWTKQPVSPLGLYANSVFSITGTSAADLYATARGSVNGKSTARILRNSGSGWRDLAIPSPYATGVTLTDSVAIGPDNAWVTGSIATRYGPQATLLHVRGSQVIPSAIPGYGSTVVSNGPFLGADPAGHLWIVTDFRSGPSLSRSDPSGNYVKTTFLTANAIDQTIAPVSTSTAYVGGSNLLLVNIDTNTTTKVALPGSPAFVTQVVANGPDDVWALASADPSFQVRVLYHFDGVTWSTVPLPSPDTYQIALSSDHQLWAQGQALSPTVNPSEAETAVSRYDAASESWTTARSAVDDVVAGNEALPGVNDLLALPQGELYAVGVGNGQQRPFIESLCTLASTLTGGPAHVALRALGDDALVTGPDGVDGASITDTTGLLTSGPVAAGGSTTLAGLAAGTFTLVSSTGATATLAVPTFVIPAPNKTTVQFATEPAPAGYAYQLQGRPTGTTAWRTLGLSPTGGGTSEIMYPTVFTPGGWQVRSRVVNNAGGNVASGWSPTANVVVPD